ncbi:diaminopimelate epimerase [Benzoatithermus flavus]|uniref:Diaminopimelate epimerase n=1 Tax=Benzoatithermus flavus TaxID=3108223 RepID=A0ABU8XU94_9PROT
MSPIAFLKMHGCGNDFVVLDARRAPLALTPAQVRRIADRHRGVGCDQLVLLEPAADADVRLRFLNSDGSESGACGNGTRCAARLLFEEGAQGPLSIVVGERRLVAERLADGRIAVAMGEPRFDWRQIPLAEPCDTKALPIAVEGLPRPVAVSMGNPHAVFFVRDLASLDVPRLGALLERHPLFPERANIGFAQALAPGRFRLRVFERGAGLTLACGSGACAAMVAARRLGLAGDTAELILDGGTLEIRWPGNGSVVMIGPAAQVFSGTLDPELLNDGAD